MFLLIQCCYIFVKIGLPSFLSKQNALMKTLLVVFKVSLLIIILNMVCPFHILEIDMNTLDNNIINFLE